MAGGIVENLENDWLVEAINLTNGDRMREYGHPLTNFLRASIMWSVALETPISPRMYVVLNMLAKSSRELNKHKDDNHIDSAGYSRALQKATKRMDQLGYEMEEFENRPDAIQLMWECFLKSSEIDKAEKRAIDRLS